MGSPLQTSASTPPVLKGKQTRQSGKESNTAPVTVLVPVYAGYEETLACLHSVLASQAINQTPFQLLVVNDASPDAALVDQLTLLAEQKRLILHLQPINRGFIDTVNLGLTQSCGHDVILLNADTLVHGNWVDRLRETAYQMPTTASVTPLTNNGELMSLLGPCNPAEALTPTQLARLDHAAQLANGEKEDQSVAIHTGCGFCLYLRHDALAELGGLDPTLTRGYGEESDWCYRAEARGWQHQGALDVVVAHQGGISFGDEKRLRVKQNLQIINARYPESSPAFDTCLQQDPMRPGRERVIRHWLYQQPHAALWHPASADGVLNVWPSLAQAQRDSRSRGVSMARTSGQLILEGSAPHAWRLRYHLPAERQTLLQDLQALGVHHFAATTSSLQAWLSSALPELPTQNAHSPGLPRPTPPSTPLTQGLVIALGEPESLNHPTFIRWVAALEREQSTLRVLHTRPLPAHHPLASSGRLFYAPLSHHGDETRTQLLIEHLPLAGALALDDDAATQADLAWLTAQRSLPIIAIPAEATQPRVGATA
nr:glycosyltransferase [Halomonas salicampi]